MIRKALLSSACLVLVACVSSRPAEFPHEPTLEEAISDASLARPERIFNDLNAVSLDNPRLRSQEIGGERWVLTVTWVSHPGFDDQVGKDYPLPDGAEPWVTLSPELQSFCRALPPGDDERSARMIKLLGLRPDKPKKHIVELWVREKDLFRPCPDAEIHDRSCELSFPPGADPEHVKWFQEKQQGSYGPDGYPWTRLGYTYDWGRGDGVTVGLSEYVIRKKSTVKVASVSTVAEYCR